MNKMNLLNMIPYFIMIIIMMTVMNSPKIHPTHLTLLLILYSSIVCLCLTWSMKNSIYSIILFMIMISGVLIIFLYFSSLISNEQSKINMPMFFYLAMPLLLITMLNHAPYLNQILHNEDLTNLTNINEMMSSNIKMIYEYPYSNLSVKCMVFLLLTMFSIMKVSSLVTSTLRKII